MKRQANTLKSNQVTSAKRLSFEFLVPTMTTAKAIEDALQNQNLCRAESVDVLFDMILAKPQADKRPTTHVKT